MTQLHIACAASDVAAVEMLLSLGANATLKNNNHHTAHDVTGKTNKRAIKLAFAHGTPICIALPTQALMQQQAAMRHSGRGVATPLTAAELSFSAPASLRLEGNVYKVDVINKLVAVPACLQHLVHLNLSGNPALGKIPDAIGKLSALRTLQLANCGLSYPDLIGICACVSLVALDISDNVLSNVPSEFVRLQNVRRLAMARCSRGSVPLVLTQLPVLEELDLSGNLMDRLPVALCSLSALKKLDVTDCPLTTVPSEIRGASTKAILDYLRDLSGKTQAVYRSKLLLVGYGGVGKTSLLNTMFPPEAVLKRKTLHRVMRKVIGYYQDRRCSIKNSQLVYERPTKKGGWEHAGVVNLCGAQVQASMACDPEWTLQGAPGGETRLFELRSACALDRDEWLRVVRFHTRNVATDGISVVHRTIPAAQLQTAMHMTSATPPNLSPRTPEAYQQCRVPPDAELHLSLCDFAGQYEYQDGHQMFLSSRAIYLVLWDVTPTKRATELAKLRHWLATLELQLGTPELRGTVLAYIIGTHADAPDVDLMECERAVQKVVASIPLSLPHRIIAGIDVRVELTVQAVKNLLLTDLAVQEHLGELVPAAYFDLEHRLMCEHDLYRVKLLHAAQNSQVMLQGGAEAAQPEAPLFSRTTFVNQLKLEQGVVTRGLQLLHLWGRIIYLGGNASRPSLDDLVVAAPEWLTVSVLGSLVQVLRVQLGRRSRVSFDGSDDEALAPVVQHAELLRLFPLWRALHERNQAEQVLEMLYAFDLGFPERIADRRAFAERASLFPQLLPALPSRRLEWSQAADTPEIALVVELNGIPMGFHTVLFSRLRAYFQQVEFASCWQSGFLFRDEEQLTLVTILEDCTRVRFCVRNANDFSTVFATILGSNESPGVFRRMLRERFRGLRIVSESVECVCDSCKSNRKWHWSKATADQVASDPQITSLLTDTTARAELAAVVARHLQPDGRPSEFSINEVISAASSRTGAALVCRRSNLRVTVAALTASPTTAPADGGALVARLLGVEARLNDLQQEVLTTQTEVGSVREETVLLQENFGTARRQLADLDGRVASVEQRMQAAEQAMVETVRRVTEDLRLYRLDATTSSSSSQRPQLLQDARVAAYHEMVQEVLNSAYTGALAAKSDQVQLQLSGLNGTIVSVVDAVGKAVGSVIPGASTVASVTSAVVSHFSEIEQRERLDRLVLFANPNRMFAFVEQLADAMAQVRQAALLAVEVPRPSRLVRMFQGVKEAVFYQRVRSATSPPVQAAQRLGIADAELVIELVTTSAKPISVADPLAATAHLLTSLSL